jgi:hypothetical protein
MPVGSVLLVLGLAVSCHHRTHVRLSCAGCPESSQKKEGGPQGVEVLKKNGLAKSPTWNLCNEPPLPEPAASRQRRVQWTGGLRPSSMLDTLPARRH